MDSSVPWTRIPANLTCKSERRSATSRESGPSTSKIVFFCDSIRANLRKMFVRIACPAHQGGHATARFLEGFLEGSLPVGAS